MINTSREKWQKKVQTVSTAYPVLDTDDESREFTECSCGQTVIMCNDLGLSAMPLTTIKQNMYYTSLQLDSNNITTITGGSLPANLTDISFVVNPITTIEDDAFDGSENTLTSLTFSQAHFIKLPDAFLHLNVLNFLEITESIVEDWNDKAMKHIGSFLGTLSIENVPVKTWPTWLQYFTNLTDLGIGGASIKDIPDNGLDSMINTLTDLTLNNNSLTIVPFAISKLTALQLLALDKNKIANATYLPQKSKLRSLSLNGNKLHDSKELSNVLKPYGSTLVDFEISSNQLTSFPDLNILTLISDIDFRHNRLSDPNSGSLPPGLDQVKLGSNNLPRLPRFLCTMNSVSQLFAGSNSITELEAVGFPPSTHGVELENNKLTEITNTSFPVNASITYILLNNNPLVRITDDAFKNLPHLLELQVRNTKLTRLPLALIYLPKLDEFDISDTTSLVCTCLEHSLMQWILKITSTMVKGTCGKTSVEYFYTVLSQGCPGTRGVIEEGPAI
ncbi:unnamed protein product [Candidula unifasciata]|uniref:Uncharacterized protein n=1 Tax=Candidula unifasciata TaxID=100452 RepID=A0A8S3YUE2_9EUPU|nr:unnamed protein product [Candidula unifasciata]